jgi:hypothetical protein
MNKTDKIGYDFEMANYDFLVDLGYSDYIVYCNPREPYAWKHKRCVGVDLILKINGHTFYVEESYCSRDYKLSVSWYKQTRLSRFKQYPNDSTHHYLLLTNRCQNFSECVNVCTSVCIVSMSVLLDIINQYTTNSVSITNTLQ